AGHCVTALYELTPVNAPGLLGVDSRRYAPQQTARPSQIDASGSRPDELFFLKLRYKQPDGDSSRLIETPVKDSEREFAQASSDMKFAAAVAGYGMLLRRSAHKGDLTWDRVLQLAE